MELFREEWLLEASLMLSGVIFDSAVTGVGMFASIFVMRRYRVRCEYWCVCEIVCREIFLDLEQLQCRDQKGEESTSTCGNKRWTRKPTADEGKANRRLSLYTLNHPTPPSTRLRDKSALQKLLISEAP